MSITYTLVALFVSSGQVYVEDRHLSLQACAGRAAMARQQYLSVLPLLDEKIGPVEWRCVPESFKSEATNEHGIGLSG